MMHTDRGKVVMGVRQCGKSYLVFKLFKYYLLSHGVAEAQIFEMAFDHYGNRRYRDPKLFYPHVNAAISDGRYHCVLLDEVQLLGNFEEILIELVAQDNVDVYATGSNARLLSKDIVTEFRSRGDEIRMTPLSFSEFMPTYNGDEEHGWQSYISYGGLSTIALMEDPKDKAEYLTRLFSGIYISDIVEREKVRNTRALEELLDVIASTVGSLTNPSKISRAFKSVTGMTIDPETVSNYIGYLSDAFLLERAKRYNVRGRHYIGTPHKYYFTDLGLRNARLGFRQVEQTHLMENAIYNELRGRGYVVDVGMVQVSERDGNGKARRRQLEVDFVCNRGSKRVYLQSAYDIPDAEKLAQE